MAEIVWDEVALDDLLHSPDGPVGQLIAELSARGTVVARNVVQIRTTRGGSPWPPGYTRDRTTPHGPVRGSRGGLYGGIDAPADPGIFLEHPAEQMKRPYPFLTTGLFSLEGQV